MRVFGSGSLDGELSGSIFTSSIFNSGVNILCFLLGINITIQFDAFGQLLEHSKDLDLLLFPGLKVEHGSVLHGSKLSERIVLKKVQN